MRETNEPLFYAFGFMCKTARVSIRLVFRPRRERNIHFVETKYIFHIALNPQNIFPTNNAYVFGNQCFA